MGEEDGSAEGDANGLSLGVEVGLNVGVSVGLVDGSRDGTSVGLVVGAAVGMAEGPIALDAAAGTSVRRSSLPLCPLPPRVEDFATVSVTDPPFPDFRLDRDAFPAVLSPPIDIPTARLKEGAKEGKLDGPPFPFPNVPPFPLAPFSPSSEATVGEPFPFPVATCETSCIAGTTGVALG